jgi:hypothetical protein
MNPWLLENGVDRVDWIELLVRSIEYETRFWARMPRHAGWAQSRAREITGKQGAE